jgi:FdhE protein
MPRTAAGLRTNTSSRLARLRRQRPEWDVWLSLLDEAERAAADHDSRVSRESAVASPSNQPLLQGRTLYVDSGELQSLILRLVTKAGDLDGGTSLGAFRPTRDEAVELIAAAVRQDQGAIAAVAAARELDTGALTSIIHLAALPLLRACGRELQSQIPEHWPHGYCPVCAAWACLAERRGLDRSRRLRCGRCASEWEIEWLVCVYCGERDHEKLGSLVPEDAGETLKVETCETCRGYLKSVATLQAIPAFELLLQDVETVELDLIALKREYGRPEGSGVVLMSAVVSREGVPSHQL